MYKALEGKIGEGAERSQPEPEVAEWARRELGFKADAVQERILNSQGKRVLLNCTRQWGKSTVTAAKAVHEAVVNAGSLTIAVSPTARQTGEFVRKAAAFMGKLKMKAKGDGDNEMSLAFPNGSRIVGLPGREDTVRGFSSVSLLLIDEASRVTDELYKAVRPMIAASDGTLWLMSTPNGKRGFFYEAWEHDGGSWERVRVTAEECPRIKASYLEEEKRTLGERWYRQEYCCEFGDSESGVFKRDLIEAAFSSDFEPLKI